MASFSLPTINDNPDGAWGPSTSNFPEQFKFKDIPYAPYSKSDKLGRFADWNELVTDNRQTAVGGLPSTQPTRGGRPGGRREGPQAFGTGTASAFATFHVEDDANFSVVDNRATPARRGGARGRGGGRGGAFSNRGGARGGRGGYSTTRGGGAAGQRGGRRGWRDWEKVKSSSTYFMNLSLLVVLRLVVRANPPLRSRLSGRCSKRSSSSASTSSGSMLANLKNCESTGTIFDAILTHYSESYGRLFAYEKSYDRITTKTQQPLQLLDRIKYNTTASDDPVLQQVGVNISCAMSPVSCSAQLASTDIATVFTTDAILSVLMTATRSVYSWDIVVLKEGDKIFLDKRDGGPFDTITVNENAADPPQDPTPPNPNDKNAVPEVPSINAATSLSLEATYINQNYCFQAVQEKQAIDFAKPNPFYGADETDPLASCGYRYRLFDISTQDEEDFKLCLRTEVDAFVPGQGDARAGQGLVTVRALNEFDPRAPGAGGAQDWRTKLDSQRGAVVATEMKNNSCKLAKWTIQSILAGAELMKVGYVALIS
jgi:translation initiation factor 3 subunit D